MKPLTVALLLCLCAGSSMRAQDFSQSVKSESKGYYNLSQFTLLMGEVDENSPVKSELIPSIVNISGYRFNDYFSAGLGVGMTVLPYTIFPVFADFRVTPLKSNLSPVFALKAGYAFAKNDKDIWNWGSDYTKNTGGAMINPEIGFKILMTERADFVFTLGYWYQHIESELKNSYQNQVHNRKLNLNRISFTIGFQFK
jgi:hypothetical protein